MSDGVIFLYDCHQGLDVSDVGHSNVERDGWRGRGFGQRVCIRCEPHVYATLHAHIPRHMHMPPSMHDPGRAVYSYTCGCCHMHVDMVIHSYTCGPHHMHVAPTMRIWPWCICMWTPPHTCGARTHVYRHRPTASLTTMPPKTRKQVHMHMNMHMNPFEIQTRSP